MSEVYWAIGIFLFFLLLALFFFFRKSYREKKKNNYEEVRDEATKKRLGIEEKEEGEEYSPNICSALVSLVGIFITLLVAINLLPNIKEEIESTGALNATGTTEYQAVLTVIDIIPIVLVIGGTLIIIGIVVKILRSVGLV